MYRRRLISFQRLPKRTRSFPRRMPKNRYRLRNLITNFLLRRMVYLQLPLTRILMRRRTRRIHLRPTLMRPPVILNRMYRFLIRKTYRFRRRIILLHFLRYLKRITQRRIRRRLRRRLRFRLLWPANGDGMRLNYPLKTCSVFLDCCLPTIFIDLLVTFQGGIILS